MPQPESTLRERIMSAEDTAYLGLDEILPITDADQRMFLDELQNSPTILFGRDFFFGIGTAIGGMVLGGNIAFEKGFSIPGIVAGAVLGCVISEASFAYYLHRQMPRRNEEYREMLSPDSTYEPFP